ncbi:MAG: ArnT family glycosyltransferase [Phototrophicaceae bacterium]|jgi:hypothetical protein
MIKLWRVLWTLGGVGLLAAMTAIQAARYAPPEWVQLSVWVGGLAALGVGLGWPLWSVARRNTLLDVLGLLIGALAVRAWQLQEALRVLLDERTTIVQMIFLHELNLHLLHPISPVILPYPWIYAYFEYLSVQVFGWNFAAIRVPAVIFGALTVAMVYLLARTLTQDRITALACGMSALAMPVMIHYSRIAIYNGPDPFFGTAALLALARAWRHGRRADWVIGGVCLGLTHYFFEGGRLFYAPLVIIWLSWAALFDRAAIPKISPSDNYNYHEQSKIPRWIGLGLCISVFALAVAPLYITWQQRGDAFAPRLASSGLNGTVLYDMLTSTLNDNEFWFYAQRLIDAFAVWFVIPETSPFYGGNYALVLPFVAPFTLVGIWVTLRRAFGLEVLPLLWIVALSAANGLLMAETTGSPRFVVGFPAAAILTGLGVRALAAWLTPKRASAATLITAALLGVGQIGYYYGVHLPLLNVELRLLRPNTPDMEDGLFRVHDLPPDVGVVMVFEQAPDHNFIRQLLQFLNLGMEPVMPAIYVTDEFMARIEDCRLLDAVPAGGLAILVDPYTHGLDEVIVGCYGELPAELSPYPVPSAGQFRLYRVPNR